MSTSIEKFEAKRKALYDAYTKELKKALLIGSIIGASIFLMYQFIVRDEVVLYFLIALLYPLYLFINAQRHTTEFRTIIKTEIITSLIQEKFDDAIYEFQRAMDLSTINGTGLVKRPDRYKGEDYIKGKVDHVSFEVSDVELRERVEHVDSKGHRHVSYPVYFKGRWYKFEFPKQFKGRLKVSEKRPYDDRGLTKVDTESIVFNKKFKVYVSDPQYAFYHLTPIMMEKLLELEAMHRGSIYFYYDANELHIGVNDNQDYLEIPFHQPINEARMKRFEGDLDLILAIIHEMKLNTEKFK
jgi:hypothetical protein